jgi:hypothetical protein
MIGFTPSGLNHVSLRIFNGPGTEENAILIEQKPASFAIVSLEANRAGC